MSEAQHDPKELFKMLSRLTNEDIPKDSDLYDHLNALQGLINREFLELLEETHFPRKYEIFDQVKELVLSVRLRTMIPELIDKHMVGFFQPDSKSLSRIWSRFLKKTLPEYQYGKVPILSSVPTLIVHDEESDLKLCAFSVGEKRVELTENEYRELLYRDKEKPGSDERVELSSVAHLILIKSRYVSSTHGLLILPKECDELAKYYQTILGLIDTLVLTDPHVKNRDYLNEKLYESNIKFVYCCQVPAGSELRLKRYAPTYITAGSFGELAEDLTKDTRIYHNINNRIVLDCIFSEIFWFLGCERQLLNTRLEQVNVDVSNENENISALAKSMRKSVSEQLEGWDGLCKRSRTLLSDMEWHLRAIENLLGETNASFNDHALTLDDLVGHFYRMCVFYRETQYSNHTQSVDSLQSYCSDNGSGQLADIIADDYYGRASSSDNLEYLSSYVSLNPYIGRLRLRHRKELGLDEKTCGEIIASLLSPLTPEEQRLNGQYLYQLRKTEQARSELYAALAQGDEEAGHLMLKYFTVNTSAREDIALFGSAEAAMQVGKEKAGNWNTAPLQNTAPQREQLFTEAVKFLNIAAAGGEAEAYKLLSDLWFRRGMGYMQRYGEAGVQAKNCFNACLRNAEKSPMGSRDYTQMGTAAFHLKNYISAMEYLKKAETGDAYALLGYMYENGVGTAKNRSTALSRYEKAMNLGNTQARVSYDKLFAELEAEKKAKEESERTSYSSYTYYSGYSSYSDW
ncbi:MAG: hypothetical protein J1F18_12560 [Lachnospiraceae bacterium]|nr:hypothetical protein [Lachnospiraceae bacterium]